MSSSAHRVTPGDLDPVIHERVRLSIASVLASRRAMDYLELKELLGLTDGNLAGHVRVLEEAGYLAIEKGFTGKRTRTRYSLTPRGRAVFQRHVAALDALIRGGAPR